MKKIVILFISLVILLGMNFLKKDNREVNLTVFYTEYCSYCEQFKKYAVPELEKNFSNINIVYKELYEHQGEYDDLIAKTENFDENEYLTTPVIVFDSYFMVVGYGKGEEKALKQDIIKALDNKPLGKELELYRWEFIK